MADISPELWQAINMYSRMVTGAMHDDTYLNAALGFAHDLGGRDLEQITHQTIVNPENVQSKDLKGLMLGATSPTRVYQIYQHVQPPQQIDPGPVLSVLGQVPDLGAARQLPMQIDQSTRAEMRRWGLAHQYMDPMDAVPSTQALTQLSTADPGFLKSALDKLPQTHPAFAGPLWSKGLGAAQSGSIGQMMSAINSNYGLGADLFGQNYPNFLQGVQRFKLPILAGGAAALGLGMTDPEQAQAVDFDALRKMPVEKLLAVPEFAHVWEYLAQQGDSTTDVVNKWEQAVNAIKESPADPTLHIAAMGNPDTPGAMGNQHYSFSVEHPAVRLPVMYGEFSVTPEGIAHSFEVNGIGANTLGPRGTRKVLLQLAQQVPDITGIEDLGRVTGVAKNLPGGVRTSRVLLPVVGGLALGTAMQPDQAQAMPQPMAFGDLATMVRMFSEAGLEPKLVGQGRSVIELPSDNFDKLGVQWGMVGRGKTYINENEHADVWEMMGKDSSLVRAFKVGADPLYEENLETGLAVDLDPGGVRNAKAFLESNWNPTRDKRIYIDYHSPNGLVGESFTNLEDAKDFLNSAHTKRPSSGNKSLGLFALPLAAAGALGASASRAQASETKPTGMIEQGNLDPFNRPTLKNPDGSVSTTSSISIGTDKGEVLIPTVINGQRFSAQDAIQHYKQTGEHLGIFDTPEHADQYAQALHNAQAAHLGLGPQNPMEGLQTPQEIQRVYSQSGGAITPPVVHTFDAQQINEFAGLIDPEQHGIPTIKSLEQNPAYQVLTDQMKVLARRRLFDQFYVQNPQLTQLRQTDPAAWNRIRTQYIGLPLPGIGEKLIAAVGEGAADALMMQDPHRQIVEHTLNGDPGWAESVARLGTQLAAFIPTMGATKAIGLAAGVRAGLSEFAGNATLMAMQEAAKTRANQKEMLMRSAEDQFYNLPITPTKTGELMSDAQKSLGTAAGQGFEGGALFDLGLRAGFRFAKLTYGAMRGVIGLLFHHFPSEAAQVIAGKIPDANKIPGMLKDIAGSPEILDPGTDIVQQTLLNSPRLVVYDGDLVILLKNGQQVDPGELVNGMYRAPLQRDALGKFIKGSGGMQPVTWDQVAEIRGQQDHINILFDAMGLGARLKDAPDVTVKIMGGEIRRLGRNWVLIDNAGKMQSFKSQEEVLQAAKKMQIPMWSMEHAALKPTADSNTGVNVIRATDPGNWRLEGDLNKLADFHSNAPPPGRPPDAGLGAMGEGPEKISYPGQKPPIGGSIAFGRLGAPPKRTFLRIENQTKVPIYTKLYEPMEEALLRSRREVRPWIEGANTLMKGVRKGEREGYALALQTSRGSQAEQDLIQSMKLDPGKVASVRDYFDNLFDHLGAGDASDYFLHVVPRIQVARTLKAAYPDKVMLPPSLQFFKSYIESGHIPLWRQNLDVSQLMHSHAQNGFFQKYGAPVLDNAEGVWKDLITDEKTPKAVRIMAQNYIDDIRGNTSPMDAMMMQALGKGLMQTSNALRRIRGHEVDPITAEEANYAARRFYGWMFSLNYASNLAFRPAAVARQFLQTEQTTAVRFGHRPIFGSGGAIERLGTKAGQDFVDKAGILVEEAPFQAEGVPTIGGKIFRRADNIQRAIAAHAQDYLFEKHLPTYTKRGDWQTFINKSKLVKYDPIIQGQLKDMIDNGDLMGARLRAAREASEDTQFIYRKGNQPALFRGVAGKVFGQYGVWPAYYGDFMTQTMRQGPLSVRATEMARFIAINGTLGAVFTGALGASAASWLWFQPLNFTGGPIFQIGTSAYTAAFGRGPERDIAQYRLAPNLFPKRGGKPTLGAVGQFVPGHQMMRDLYGVSQQIDKGDGIGVMRELLGYPAAKP